MPSKPDRRGQNNNHFIHGLSHLPEFRLWHDIKRRCYDPRVKEFANYGAHGIRMCESWRASFKSFIEDMGKRPSSEHSINRVNNNGDYSPSNCQWATRTEQNRNTQRTCWIIFEGRKQSMAAWAEEVNLPYKTMQRRLNNLGWTVKKTLTTPVRGHMPYRNSSC